MFGYVMANKPELKLREFQCYRSFYCGLCHTLSKRFGQRGRMLLNYDMTFLYLLLTSLYELPCARSGMRCISHPVQKQPVTISSVVDYVSDMNLLLAYYNLEDDVHDTHKLSSFLYSLLLRKQKASCSRRYPRQAKAITQYISKLHEAEKTSDNRLDMVANLTGEMLRSIFCYRNDEWAQTLGEVGFYLGKFIYLVDAFEDMEADKKSGSYNIWLGYRTRPDFESYVNEVLTSMMADCTAAFERLPILDNLNLLRNILYSGVWTRYELTVAKRRQVNTQEK